jgi:AcrR family transcriptional regulator
VTDGRTGGRRADARRNRELILDAARAAFATTSDASMAEVARRAGIGPATLYRNFPDRLALLEALYTDEIDTVSAAAEAAVGASPMARLQSWLRQFHDYFTGKRALATELLQHVDPDSAVFSEGYRRISSAASPLIDAAHASGELRADLGLEQVLALVGSVAAIPGPSAYREPILAAALDGLRAAR